MILGRGTAQTDKDIIAEYHQLLRDTCHVVSCLQQLQSTPQLIRCRIGEPILDWTDEQIIGLYRDRQHSTWHRYNSFIAFLLCRGYLRPTFRLMVTLPIDATRHHMACLAPYRERLRQARDELCYAPISVGEELSLLIWLLAIVGKPLDELTRADFDAFRDEYNAWREQNGHHGRISPDRRMFRLERYLTYLGVIPEAKPVPLCHEEYFAALGRGPIQRAILAHMQWCEAKYRPSTIRGRRKALLRFFLWLQEYRPGCSRLDDVTRPIALEYARYLKTKAEDGTYSVSYCNDNYTHPRLFFDFATNERLDTSPARNPLAKGDLPRRPDPTPRCLSDHELRTVLEYCNNGATLKQRTVVTVLLHTGIRAAELAALQVEDIVRIQGKWKIHIREGKGLKDRLIPLTDQCLAALQVWQEEGWEHVNDHLFTRYGRPWSSGRPVCVFVRKLGDKAGIRLTPHRFRHTFAVALINYGIRESALRKLMGHADLRMTLEYARILDRSVEQAFNEAIERMRTGPLSWVPSFFAPEDYTFLAESDALNWIRLPLGYCRRHPNLHCESDVKCLLCDRFCALPSDLPRLQEMHDRFCKLGMDVKSNVINSRIHQLKAEVDNLPTLGLDGPQCAEPLDTQGIEPETRPAPLLSGGAL